MFKTSSISLRIPVSTFGAALLMAGISFSALADQSVSGRVENLPKDYSVTIRLQAAKPQSSYETTTKPDGSWIIRSVSEQSYTVSIRRPQGSTLGICFSPESRAITVRNRDVTGVNFRAEWPRESCPSGPAPTRTASGVVLFLEGSDRATVIATASDSKTYRATTGPKGAWQISDLPAGRYHFQAECAHYTIVPPDVTVDLTRGDQNNVSFRAQRAAKE